MRSQRGVPEVIDLLLSNGYSFEPRETRKLEALRFLEELELVRASERWLYRCVNLADQDYRQLFGEDLRCQGTLSLPFRGGEKECPECGRWMDLNKKSAEHRIAIDGILWNKIAEKILSQAGLTIVEHAFGTYQVRLSSCELVSVAFPETIRANEFFSYDPNAGHGVIITKHSAPSENLYAITPGEALSKPDNLLKKLRRSLRAGEVPGIRGSRLLDALDALEGRRDWQFFESELLSSFLESLKEGRRQLEKYFHFLWDERKTIFGSLVVKIGGSGRPDLRTFSKWDYLHRLLQSEQLFDAKCYQPVRSIGIGEFRQALDFQQTLAGNQQSVIIVAKTDRVTVWEKVATLKDRKGMWPVVIIPRKLFVELAVAAGADEDMADMIDEYLNRPS